MGRLRDKLSNISMLVAAADTPVPLVLDSVRLQRHAYTARLRSGLSFSLEPLCGEWFTLLECAVRMDYFRNGIEVHEGDTVIDVGANFGAFTIAASRKVGDSGRVFCYEPNPFVFERLQQNIRLNGCRTSPPSTKPWGDKAGKSTCSSGASRRSAPRNRKSTAVRPAARTPRECRCARWSPRSAWPDRRWRCLKIDCEGGEYDILEHLTADAASASQPGVDGSPPRVPGRSVDSIPQLLAALGFDVVATSPLTAFRRTRARPTA